MAGVAGDPACLLEGPLAQDHQEGLGHRDRHLHRGPRRGPLLRLDRRPGGRRRRPLVAAAVHTPGVPEQVVEDQLRPGDRADRGGADAPRRALGVERARADGRWEAAYDSPSRATSPRTWPSMPTPTPGILRHAGPHQPLRHPVPDPRRQTARDPGSAPQDVRCHARSGREALSLTPRSPAVRTGQAPAGAAAPRRRRWRRDG